MRPSKFEYERPESLDQAIELLGADPENKALAGGHSLLPAMNLRLAQPPRLVDIGRLDGLKPIEVRNGRLSIGALATHAQIARSPEVRRHAPALAAAAAIVGDPQVRNWGTIGGNLAHADPASDPPTVVVAQDGVIHLKGPDGDREVAAQDFFTDLFTTDLRPGELITRIELPSAQSGRSAYQKLAHPASRYAVVGVCVILEMAEDECRSARIAVGGATPHVRRTPDTESLLAGSPLDDATLTRAADRLQQEIGEDLIGDQFAPADYRRAMCGVFFKRAVRQALG